MNIVCAIDQNYVPHCATLLRSLRDHNPEDDLAVYIVHQKLPSATRAELLGYLSSFLPSVSLIQVDDSLIADFPVFGHVSLATYYRLLTPLILPYSVKRALYIDSDAIVADSLRPLWDTPLGDLPVAAVHDQNISESYRLGLRDPNNYFNGGVLLFNVETWRHEKIAEKGFQFVRSNPDKIKHWDQDVLNYLFEDRCLIVAERWNACPHLWGLNPLWQPENGQFSAMETEARDHPAIVHFAGSGLAKPWTYGCRHAWTQPYLEVRHRTPWGKFPLDGQPAPRLERLLGEMIFKAKCVGKEALSKLGG